MEIAAARMAGHVVQDAPEGLTLEIRTIGVAHEIEVHLCLFEDNLLDAKLFATDTKGHHTDQFFADFRYLSEAICQTLAIGRERCFEVIAACEVVELAVEQHALRIRRHILVREIHFDVGLEGAVGNEE